jgi:flagellar hook-associated protein 2
MVRDTAYKALTGNSSTPSGDVTALRDIGVTLTAAGDLQFSESDYDAVASKNFQDITKMLSAGTTNQSKWDGEPQGFAKDAIIELEALTDSISGIFTQRTKTAQSAVSRYEIELEDLNKRYEKIYDRYIAQFTVMESIVNQLNSTRESLATTWENMGKFEK